MEIKKVSDNPNPNEKNSVSFERRKKEIEEEEKRETEAREAQKKSPFKRFLQVNKDTWKAEDWLMSKSPIAYRIFRFLMNNMDSYNAVMCSYKVMQEHFDVSADTIRRAIKILKDKQYIGVYKSGTSNVYVINKYIAWNSWGNNYKYAEFGARIILSESEQEEQTKLKIKKQREISLSDENDL